MRTIICLFVSCLFLTGCGGSFAYQNEILGRKLSPREEKAKNLYAELYARPSKDLKQYIVEKLPQMALRLQRDFAHDAEIKNIVEQIGTQNLFDYLPYIRERAPEDSLTSQSLIEFESRALALEAHNFFGVNTDPYHDCLANIPIGPSISFAWIMDSTLECWYDSTTRGTKLLFVDSLLRFLFFMKEISRLPPIQQVGKL